MIKLVITDVDDTIVKESSSEINPEYYDVIREFRKKGVLFGVASGRQKPCVQNLFRPVLDDIFILADNGTDVWTKDFQDSNKMNHEHYSQMIRDVKKYAPGYGIMSCKPDVAYFEPCDEVYVEFMKTYPYVCEYVDDLTAVKDICKVSVWEPKGLDLSIVAKLKEIWSDKLDVATAGDYFLDFMSQGSNKGSALKKVQEHYGISPEETVAFGNADNDIPMIRQSKYGYAVQNSSENLKRAAYEVIGDMREDAVLKKMRKLLETL